MADAIPSGCDFDPTGPRKPADQIIVKECEICGSRNTYANGEPHLCKNERCGKLPAIQSQEPEPKPLAGRAKAWVDRPPTVEKVYPCRVKR